MSAPRLSLVAERHPLASPQAQRDRLAQIDAAPFPAPVHASAVEILQLNVGKRCNQTCAHCHVDAGPDRTEVMSDAVVDASLAFLAREHTPILDVTGGAPELHARFRDIVLAGRAAGARVIDRCNLTVLHGDLAQFLADNQVEIVASLPSTDPERTDAQRGAHVFERSIAALRALNAVGYGTSLPLSLMSNPTGAFLPPPERQAEADFKRALDKLGVRFTRLSVLTNMPIARFLAWLDHSGNTERYVKKLASAYNPAAVAGLMCKNTLSVGWDGALYDCDFNQMLELPAQYATGARPTIFDALADDLRGRRVVTGPHCYGCTAGQGSSCGGALS
ncbi:MAG TPA: arsenosugar biosynthesis radical SAM (seleno)protein ArsS [Myxococcota bacterium]